MSVKTKSKPVEATTVSYETVKELHRKTQGLAQNRYNLRVSSDAPFSSWTLLGVTFARSTTKFDRQTKERTREIGVTTDLAPELVATVMAHAEDIWLQIGVREDDRGNIRTVRLQKVLNGSTDSRAFVDRLKNNPSARVEISPVTGEKHIVYEPLSRFLSATELSEDTLLAQDALVLENEKLKKLLAERLSGE